MIYAGWPDWLFLPVYLVIGWFIYTWVIAPILSKRTESRREQEMRDIKKD